MVFTPFDGPSRSTRPAGGVSRRVAGRGRRRSRGDLRRRRAGHRPGCPARERRRRSPGSVETRLADPWSPRPMIRAWNRGWRFMGNCHALSLTTPDADPESRHRRRHDQPGLGLDGQVAGHRLALCRQHGISAFDPAATNWSEASRVRRRTADAVIDQSRAPVRPFLPREIDADRRPSTSNGSRPRSAATSCIRHAAGDMRQAAPSRGVDPIRRAARLSHCQAASANWHTCSLAAAHSAESRQFGDLGGELAARTGRVAAACQAARQLFAEGSAGPRCLACCGTARSCRARPSICRSPSGCRWPTCRSSAVCTPDTTAAAGRRAGRPGRPRHAGRLLAWSS